MGAASKAGPCARQSPGTATVRAQQCKTAAARGPAPSRSVCVCPGPGWTGQPCGTPAPAGQLLQLSSLSLSLFFKSCLTRSHVGPPAPPSPVAPCSPTLLLLPLCVELVYFFAPLSSPYPGALREAGQLVLCAWGRGLIRLSPAGSAQSPENFARIKNKYGNKMTLCGCGSGWLQPPHFSCTPRCLCSRAPPPRGEDVPPAGVKNP